jgi:hypothetical protein
VLNHRGTEDTESAQSHTSQTRRHEDTKAAHPPEETADNADRRRWSHAKLEPVTRSRPSPNDGRGPLDRTIASDASVRRDVTAQRPALSKSAGLATPSFHSKLRRQTSVFRGGEVEPMRPGRVGRWEARRRRTPAFEADVLLTGGRRSPDRRLFHRHSSALPHHVSGVICVHLRDLRFLRGRVIGFAMPSCLRVFVFAMSSVFLSVSSVPLWFNTWAGGHGNGVGQGIMSAVKGDIS